jgi:NifB/MoaA-like Fe-S oxidoreductase
MERTLSKIFRNSTHIKVILRFYNEPRYFDNVTGLAKSFNKSHVTMRKVISDLIEVGILSELDIGKSKVIRLSEDSLYTKALFEFIDSLHVIKKDDK